MYPYSTVINYPMVPPNTSQIVATQYERIGIDHSGARIATSKLVHHFETTCHAFDTIDDSYRVDALKREFPCPQAGVCSRAQYRIRSNPLDYVHPTHTRIGNLDGPLLPRSYDVPDVDVSIQ